MTMTYPATKMNNNKEEKKAFKIEELKRSAKSYWLKRLHYVEMLNVWAACHKAQAEGIIPTRDALWGTTGYTAMIFRHARTGEMIVATERPRGNWENFGSMNPKVNEGSSRVDTGIYLVGISVELVLRRKLGTDDISALLELLPMTGKYQGAEWLDETKHQLLREEDSLRNLFLKTKRDTFEERDSNYMTEAVLTNKAVLKAVRVLEQKMPRAPEGRLAQPQLLKP